jgi:hypothetical protein
MAPVRRALINAGSTVMSPVIPTFDRCDVDEPKAAIRPKPQKRATANADAANFSPVGGIVPTRADQIRL